MPYIFLLKALSKPFARVDKHVDPKQSGVLTPAMAVRKKQEDSPGTLPVNHEHLSKNIASLTLAVFLSNQPSTNKPSFGLAW